ncbi:family 78 glycoside hydrolase catalytic domain [Streptomyces sp. NPDC002779]|uniref:family 78 glycoside hydrolase catalytic domain n=1 Tax=Streptomyces sp. NPDC002779 TaxID=3364664 RepID=UPI0036CB9B8A
MTHLWTDGAAEIDAHVGVRAVVDLPQECRLVVRFSASWWAVLHVDGKPVAEGPPRAPADRPEHVVVALHLAPGPHVLAFHVVHAGVPTEQAAVVAPHLWVEVEGCPDLDWRAAPLRGFRSQVRRLNNNLGFVEWCDTRDLPAWTGPGSAADAWSPAVPVPGLPVPTSDMGPTVSWTPLTGVRVAEGELVERLLLLEDDPAAGVFARQLVPDGQVPAQGVWARFDLGRIRLGRPTVEIDAPAGATVDLLYCEDLVDGRVTPWIPMSNGLSANLDHYVAAGERQRLGPVSPRAGRWVEVHVLAEPSQVHIGELRWDERSSVPADPIGNLATGSPRLDRIWQVGVDTLRACSEDALVDCPVRERGQWLGDAVVGMEIAAASHGDLRIVERSLRMAAACADDDGFVAGQGPGAPRHLASYSALWPGAVLRHAALTGSDKLLGELTPAAARNAAAFCTRRGPTGIEGDLPWPFVDWGAADDDLSISLLALDGLDASARWLREVKHRDAAAVEDAAGELRGTLARRTSAEPLGYHAATLALRTGVLPAGAEAAAAQLVLDHLDFCFPLDTAGPRLSSHLATGERFVTPYFLHFSLVELVRRGRAHEVLQRIEQLYGWLLDQGATTWWENFDPRWSRCHQWSGTPTWLLSRMLLGLWVEPEGGLRLELLPGERTGVSGRLPLPGGGAVEVSWRRDGRTLRWSARPTGHLELRQGDVVHTVEPGAQLDLVLPTGPSSCLTSPHWITPGR